jgi:ABC-type glutathione transport system ATPase component
MDRQNCTILIIGKSGSGKSTVGNMILNYEGFGARISASCSDQITQADNSVTRIVQGWKLTVCVKKKSQSYLGCAFCVCSCLS